MNLSRSTWAAPLAVLALAALPLTVARTAGSAPAADIAAQPAPQLRSALVVRAGGAAFAVVRLTDDLPRHADGSVRAQLSVGGRRTGRVVSLDRVSFRHYCFRAALRRPWPAVGRRVAIVLRPAGLRRALRAVRRMQRARANDRIGARLGCRLPTGAA